MIDVAQLRGITMFTNPLKQTFTQLSKDKRGNFAMMAAIVTPLLLAGGGVALDLANQTAMKTRFQAAADSVSLTVATRIANGDLTVANAEDFGEKLLLAQMTSDNSRFSDLKVLPEVNIQEIKSGGNTTWNVKVGGRVSQSTTPFSKLMGYDEMEVEIASTSTNSTISAQGALSMAVVVDVSGSMGWLVSEYSQPAEIALGINYVTLGYITDYLQVSKLNHKLSDQAIKKVINSYNYDKCDKVYYKKNKRKNFLRAISKPLWTDANTAYNYCVTPVNALDEYLDAGGKKNKLKNNLNLILPYLEDTKIEALRDATAELFNQLSAADKDKKYVRTGLSAYSSSVQGTTEMEWGTNAALLYTSKMTDGGGTSSTASMKWAYSKLESKNKTEVNAHKAKSGQADPDKFIVFMTDGDNNYSSDNTATEAKCKQAEKDGITIYTVAFAAPPGGQALLRNCATSPENYYSPETASELIAAFSEIAKSSSEPLKTRLLN
jgi:Flp pilus assembly protein TadG